MPECTVSAGFPATHRAMGVQTVGRSGDVTFALRLAQGPDVPSVRLTLTAIMAACGLTGLCGDSVRSTVADDTALREFIGAGGVITDIIELSHVDRME